jgi:hypothetical protein
VGYSSFVPAYLNLRIVLYPKFQRVICACGEGDFIVLDLAIFVLIGPSVRSIPSIFSEPRYIIVLNSIIDVRRTDAHACVDHFSISRSGATATSGFLGRMREDVFTHQTQA